VAKTGKPSQLPALVLIALGTTTLWGCFVDLTGTAPIVAGSTKNKVPVISAFDYSPKSAIAKSDFVTFTLVANDPEREALQYNWVSTKGQLTANSGSTAAWRPLKADGSLEPGLATVMVVVSDGAMTTTASVNIMIDATGQATISNVNVPKAGDATPTGSSSNPPYCVQLPSASATPTPAASAAFGPETVLLKLESLQGVSNDPPNKTIVTLDKPVRLTKMMTYHWNSGAGTPPGTLALKNTATGVVQGPWSAIGVKSGWDGSAGSVWPTTSNGPPYLYWLSQPNVDVPAGTYEVVDSDPATWSYTSDLNDRGVAFIYGKTLGGP
jgi:hypothetical protein